MEVYHEHVGEVTTIAPAGRIDSTTSQELDNQLREIVSSDSTPVVLDLNRVDYISSAGLRIILALAKRIGGAEGKLALHGLQPNIKEVFDISGFSTILTICDTRDAAFAAVAG